MLTFSDCATNEFMEAINWLETVQSQTQLPLEVINWPPAGGESWLDEIQFDAEGERVVYSVRVNKTHGLRGVCTTHPEDAPRLESLFSLACENIRLRRALESEEQATHSFSEHVTGLYEQIHALAHLSRLLRLTSPTETILEQLSQTAQEYLNTTEIMLLKPNGFDRRSLRRILEMKCEELVFIDGNLFGDAQGTWMAARIEVRAGVGWLVTAPSRSGNSFGSEHGQCLITMARMLESHLRNQFLFEQQEDLLTRFVQTLVSALDARDHYTQGHSIRVAIVARKLAQLMGLGASEVEAIYTSGVLHDIGKIGVNDAVLLKEGKLSDEEWRAIQQHPAIGYDILKQIPQFEAILPGVRHHHERVDGKGYPDQLRADEISLMARILAVADGYDAMRSDRVYRAGMSAERVDEILASGAGTQWDDGVIAVYSENRVAIHALWESLGDASESILPPKFNLK